MSGIPWEAAYRPAAAVGVALVLDALAGDPPGRWHPVAWMGAAIDRLRRRAPGRGQFGPFLAGCLIVLGGAALFGGAGWAAAAGLRHMPDPSGWLIEGVLLKMTLAPRGLARAAHAVATALAAGDLREARRLVARHLVSRDTGSLGEHQVAAAAVESVAENASDGVVAPLFWYALGGLPAALAYRFVNTADAMLGYRDPAREWLGKAPARLDDLANLVPSRLTAALTVALAGRPARAARAWWRDCRQTASPNAGHPMAAAAGALGVELTKAGAYTLNPGARQPDAGDIRRAVRLLWRVAAAAGALLAAAAAAREVFL